MQEGTPSQLSIQQVNEYLDQLALFSKYSDTNGQRPGTIVPSQPREAILKQLFEVCISCFHCESRDFMYD